MTSVQEEDVKRKCMTGNILDRQDARCPHATRVTTMHLGGQSNSCARGEIHRNRGRPRSQDGHGCACLEHGGRGRGVW